MGGGQTGLVSLLLCRRSLLPSLLPSFLEEERRDTDLMKKLFWPQLLMKSYDLSSGSSLSTAEL